MFQDRRICKMFQDRRICEKFQGGGFVRQDNNGEIVSCSKEKLEEEVEGENEKGQGNA